MALEFSRNRRSDTITQNEGLASFNRDGENWIVRVLSRFIIAATSVGHFPAATLPEIAFLGRSNVGKSSVINSLLGTKIAKTSSTPGRTRSINFYEVRWPGKPQPELMFADLPGYGYARAPRQVTEQWGGFIEPYLKERRSLVLCLALIDLNVPLQGNDQKLFRFLDAIGRPFLVVGTKSDRLSGNTLPKAIDGIVGELPGLRILPYSARTGLGRDEAWREIRTAAESLDSPPSKVAL